MLDLRYRALGLGFLATSGVTTLVHRKIFEMARHGSAQPAELAVGLLTFMLASAGVLLLIHGSRLFARELPHRSPARDERRPTPLRREANYGSAMRKREFDLE